ncbi:MAG: flippase [Acidobacteriota bacterium]
MIPSFLHRRWLAGVDPHLYEVIEGASVSFVLRALATGLSFAFNLLLARLLGAEGAGLYYLALSVTAIGGVLGRLGLPNALLRFSAGHAAKEEWDKLAGLYREGMRTTVLASVAAMALVLITAPQIAELLFSEPALAAPLRLISLSILPSNLLSLHSELLRGLRKIREALLVQAVGVPLISAPFLAWLGSSWGVMGAVTAYLGATVLALCLGAAVWRRTTPQLRGLSGEFDRRLLVRTSLPMFWVAVTSLMVTWTDTILLGVWQDSESVGIYGIAVRLSALTSFILVAVNTVAAPKFAALYAQNDLRLLGSLARRTTTLMTLLATPLLILFMLVPHWVLRLFGPEFQAGGVALAILAVGQFVNVATGSVGYLLIMCGHEREYRKIMVTFAGFNLLLNILLIPKYGIEGAALATAATVAFGNIALAVMVYRKLSINSLPSWNWSVFSAK